MNYKHNITLADIVNIDEAISCRPGQSNPHNVRPWLFLDHGFVVGVFWADCLQDALDGMVDENKLDYLQVDESEAADYGDTEEEREERWTRLGNASEPFDIETLTIVEMNTAEFWRQFFAASFKLTAALIRL